MAGIVDIAKNTANVAGITQNEAKAAIEQCLLDIVAVIQTGEKVILKGFGTFTLKHKAARTGRNPATGESLEIAAKDVLHFKPAVGVLPEKKTARRRK